MVIYFTGTGNSRFVAETIAKRTDDELISFRSFFNKEREMDLHSTKPYVIVCPIYAGGLPEVVTNFIKNAKLDGSKEVYFITTCGANSGKIVNTVNKIITKRNLVLKGFAEIVMLSNYIIMYNPPTKEEADKTLKDSLAKIEEITTAIINGEEFELGRGFTLFDNVQSSGLVNKMFHKFMAKDNDFYVTDDCVGCNLCEKACPVVNITMEDSRPKWNGSCTHCVGCINVCPHDAVKYKDKVDGKNKYYLPANSNIE